jgi:nucleotide-binding universal stress UspA family protein
MFIKDNPIAICCLKYMNFKTILVPFSGNKNEISALAASFYLARMYNSQVKILNISPDPRTLVSASYNDMGVPTPSFATLAEEIEQANLQHQNKTYIMCRNYAAANPIPFDDGDIDMHTASAVFIHETGDADRIIANKGRLSDVIIMGRAIVDDPVYSGAFISALFESGSPVIVTPLEEIKEPGNNILIAWNGSAQAARAVTAAMPLLKYAQKIYALQINGDKEGDAPGINDLTLYLKANEINVEPISEDAKGYSVGVAIMKKAGELDIDLLVMGAFTHNRIRQMVVGGATSFMLEYADIPVFMAH